MKVSGLKTAIENNNSEETINILENAAQDSDNQALELASNLIDDRFAELLACRGWTPIKALLCFLLRVTEAKTPSLSQHLAILDRLLEVLVLGEDLELIGLTLEIIGKCMLDMSGELFEKQKKEVVRTAFLAQALMEHFNNCNEGNKLKIYELFQGRPGFERLLNNLNEQERELNQATDPDITLEADASRTSKTYEEILGGSSSKPAPKEQGFGHQSARKTAVIEAKSGLKRPFTEICSDLGIERESPRGDSIRVRLLFSAWRNDSDLEDVLAVILKAATLNASIAKLTSQHPDSQDLFPAVFSSIPELFALIKSLTNLFFLPLRPSSHFLTLSTIRNLVSRVPLKQPKQFMTSIFSYKEVFLRMLKDCSGLRVSGLTNKEVAAHSLTLAPGTASYSPFFETLLSLIRSKIKQFFMNQDVIFNIYAISSLIANFANVINTPISNEGLFPFTLKAAKLIVAMLKELLPHQDYIRDFNIIDLLKTRLELDLAFLKNNALAKEIRQFSHGEFRPIPVQKLINFDCEIVKIIDTAFHSRDNLNHHHGMSALARKIIDSPFYGLLNEAMKVRNMCPLTLEVLVLAGDLAREGQTILDKVIQSETTARIIDEFANSFKDYNDPNRLQIPEKKKKHSRRIIRLLPGLMNFVHIISMNPKGAEIEKKYELFPLVLKIQLSPTLIEAMNRDVSENKHNSLVLLAAETNNFIGNLPNYRELAFKTISEILNTLRHRQDEFIKETTKILTGKSAEIHETFDFEPLVKSLNNFSEFLNKFIANRHGERIARSLLLPFIQLASFPLLSLLDSDAHGKMVKCLRHMGLICKDGGKGSNSVWTTCFDELAKENAKIEKKLGGDLENIRDLNRVINDEMAFLARHKGLRAILTEPREGAKYLESLELLGSITYIENLLDFTLYSQSIKTRGDISPLYRTVAKIYRLIVNQLNREDKFFISRLFEEKTEPEKLASRVLEVIKSANESNRLHFHENLKTFLIYCTKEITPSVKPILAETLAKMLLNLPHELFCGDLEKLIRELAQSLNILTHFSEILKDLMASLGTGMVPIELTLKLFEEGVFGSFFRFMSTVLALLGRTELDIHSKNPLFEVLQETLKMTFAAFSRVVKSVIFVPNEFDCELQINDKVLKNAEFKPFLNFIELEVLNSFAIALKPFPWISSSVLGQALQPSLIPFFEISFSRLRSCISLNHLDAPPKPSSQYAPKARKKPLYSGLPFFEEGFDSPEWQRLCEDAIRSLDGMGFCREVAELALGNLEYPAIEAALEWIMNHSEEVHKVEEEAVKLREKEEERRRVERPEKKPSSIAVLGNLLGKKRMNEVPDKEYAEECLLLLFSLSKFFLKNPRSREIERILWEFVFGVIHSRKPDIQAVLSVEIYRILYEELREWTFLVSGARVNLKLGLKKVAEKKEGGFQLQDKELGEIKGLERTQSVDLAERLRRIEGNLGLFLRAAVTINREDFDAKKKLFREKNALELLKVLEKVLESLPLESIGSEAKGRERIEDALSNLIVRVLVFVNEAFANCKEIGSKSVIPSIIGLISTMNSLAKRTRLLLASKVVVQGLLGVLSQGLKKNEGNVRLFIERKGLSELLRLESKEKREVDGAVLGLFSGIMEVLVIDQEALDLHFECEIKRFFFDRACEKRALTEFLERFREYNQREDFMRTMKRLCLVSQKKPAAENAESLPKNPALEPPKPEELKNPKGQNIITLLENVHFKTEKRPAEKKAEENLFVSLKKGVSLTSISQIEKGSMDLETTNPEPRTVDFNLKGPHFAAFHTVIDAVISQFCGTVVERKSPGNYLHFGFLLKALQILIRKYPILIPMTVKFNCSKAIRKTAGNIEEILKRLEGVSGIRKKKEVSISFLKFLIQGAGFYALDRFHGLVLELALDNYLLFEPKNKEITGFSSIIRQKILKNLFLLLRSEIEDPARFLKSNESNTATFCYTSLHVFLLKNQEVCRGSLKPEDPTFPNFLKLYGDAFKQVSLETHSNTALSVLQTPLSVLYQIYLSAFLRQDPAQRLADFKSQLIPQNTLQTEVGFFDDWKALYASEAPFESLDMNPLKLNSPAQGRPQNAVVLDPHLAIHENLDSDQDELNEGEERLESLMLRGYGHLNENDEMRPNVDEVGYEVNLGGGEDPEEEEDFEQIRGMEEEEEEDEENEEVLEDEEWNAELGENERVEQDEDQESEEEGLPVQAANMEVEEEKEEDSESLEVIEEEEKAQPTQINEVAALQSFGTSAVIQGRGVNLSVVQNLISSESIFLDSELARKYQGIVRSCESVLPLKEKELYGLLSDASTIQHNNNSGKSGFFAEWQAVFDRPLLRNESALSPKLKELPHSRLIDLDDRALLLGRLSGLDESEEMGSRNPLRLLNMLLYEREESSRNPYRNYFYEMPSHLEMFRAAMSRDYRGIEDPRGLEQAVNLQPANVNAGIERRENPENAGEIVNAFRERVMQGFGGSIEILQEEEKKSEVVAQNPGNKAEELVVEDSTVVRESSLEVKQEKPAEEQKAEVQPPALIENPAIIQDQPKPEEQQRIKVEEQQPTKVEEQQPRVEEQQPRVEEQQPRVEESKNMQIEEEKKEESVPIVSAVNFEDLGLPANFLAIHKIDVNYFNSLSEELQMEVILNHLPKDSSNIEGQNSNPSGANPPVNSQGNPPQEESKANENPNLLNQQMLDFLQELPENIRNEVLEQELASLSQQNSRAPAQPEIDNATFLASLVPELREEVLLTATPEFLETLPPEIIAEAQTLRNRINYRHTSRFWPRNMPHEIPRKDPKASGASQIQKPRLMSATIKDKSVLQRFNTLDDRILENLLSFIYCEPQVFQKMSSGLLQTLMRSPALEYKVFDALVFILQCEKLSKIKEKGSGFPFLELETRNGMVRNYENVYQEVSLRVLYLLGKLSNKSSLMFFLDRDEKRGLESLALLRERKGILLKARASNLNEFLSLAGYRIMQRSFAHLNLYIGILYTITEKVRTLGKDIDLKMDPEAIGDLCRILRVEFIDDNIRGRLSVIISVLCLEKQNLDCFIEQLRLIILSMSQGMNAKFDQNLGLLRQTGSLEESQVMSAIEVGLLEGEKKIYKIFRIIKEVFEKALTLSSRPEEKEKVQESEVKVKAVRDSFQTLIVNESLNELWINVTEMLTIMNERFPGSVSFLNPIVHKLIGVLEGFFIIYSIMRDDYAIGKQVDQIKKGPAISHFEAESESHLELERTISNLRSEKFTIDEMFAFLCEKNKKILNLMIRQNAGLLSESMSVIVLKMPKILDFDIKKAHFRKELRKLKGDRDRYTPPIRLKIRRDNLFIDSYQQLKNYNGSDIKRKITIEFVGEEGVDQGGLTREWFSLISREMFNEGYALFVRSPNGVTFQPSPQSYINGEHLQYFKFAGRVIGKALYDGYMADAYFTRAFYKHILGKPLNIFDMEDIDPDYFRNLKWILDNDIKDLGELTFSFERDNFGKIEVYDLIENGRNVPVTNENKKDYVEKISYAKMALNIKDQIQNFLTGFNELIPTQLISVFDSMELELMISGLPDIDIQDLKENTEYKHYTKDSQVIKWLWEILESLDKSEKAGFIQFVTGTSKVPIEGFKALRGINGPTRFSINKTYDNTKLPTSHTCFNQLDLPEYPSKEILRQKLLLTIREGKEGFGFL